MNMQKICCTLNHDKLLLKAQFNVSDVANGVFQSDSSMTERSKSFFEFSLLMIVLLLNFMFSSHNRGSIAWHSYKNDI